MWTVTALGRRCGVSRTAVLYYESVGLLRAASRTASGYRLYGERELQRLETIRVYRSAGIPVADIATLLDRPGSAAATVLGRRLVEIDAEIARLREHQRTIARLIPAAGVAGRRAAITKERWVRIMERAGFSDEDMRRWHAEFEAAAPDEHRQFLEFLHLPAEQIRAIRAWSRRPPVP